jgi:hypothetical protein
VETKTTDKIVPREIAALLSGERVILRETKRAVTPFGGVAVFIWFLRKIDLVEQVRRYMPIQWKSPNHIDPTTTFVAFLITVLVGAKRFAHAALLRGDQALHTPAGDEAVPDSTTRLRDHASLWRRRTTRPRPHEDLVRPYSGTNLADVPQATSTRSRGKESQTRKRQANKGSLTIGLLVPRLRSNFRLRRVLSASLGDAVARLCSELVAPRVGGGD